MARRSSSAHALNAILFEYNNAGSGVELRSDESNATEIVTNQMLIVMYQIMKAYRIVK